MGGDGQDGQGRDALDHSAAFAVTTRISDVFVPSGEILPTTTFWPSRMSRPVLMTEFRYWKLVLLSMTTGRGTSTPSRNWPTLTTVPPASTLSRRTPPRSSL